MCDSWPVLQRRQNRFFLLYPMNNLAEFFSFVHDQSGKLLTQTVEHLGLTCVSLLLAVLIGMPLGIVITRRRKLASAVLGFTGVLQTIPSIALLGFMIPLLGIGAVPAIVALFLYALLPIVRNTYTGIEEVSTTVKEAARGMGMSDMQVLVKVELPLALPVIFAGIRTATVINVGVATLAAYIAAGGLGEFIFGGIALNNTNMILAGAIPSALLAILLDFLLGRLQRLPFRTLRWGALAFAVIVPVLAIVYYFPGTSTQTLKAGFSPEFVGRADGLPGVQKAYTLTIPSVVIAPALVYKAVQQGDVDVIDGYSTDGRIKAFHLRVLDDDKHTFPPYHAAPLIRMETLRTYPELRQAINVLTGIIDDSTMTELNYRVDFLKQQPRDVARSFLADRGIVLPAAPQRQGTIVLGSKIFSEQYILAEMYAALITAYTGLQVQTKTGLGGTKICFDALRAGEIDMYVEYTGTGLQVLLPTTQKTLDSLGGNSGAIYAYVDAQCNALYDLDWLEPLGFNNTYALMMTEEKAARLGIRSISDLRKYLR